MRWLRGVSRACALAVATLVWFAAPPALAHKPSDSYLSIMLAGGTLSGRWDIALRDLDFAIGLDADGDGAIRWREVRSKHAEIAAYAAARLALRGDERACTIGVGEQLLDDHTDGTYTVLPLAIDCGAAPASLEIGYTLFADLDPQHRGLLNLRAHGQARAAVLDAKAGPQRFMLGEVGRWAQFADYLREGVWHIWIGFDHILFLLSLLLPAVLAWRAARWQPVQTFREAFWDVLRIVTSFTVAHSITLSLAALGIVALPSRLVESAIAASVVVAALNNLKPLVQGRRWIVAFGFGLIHGFGFASVLAELGLPRDALVLALVGFNVGVELGQLAIVALFLPLAYSLRRTAFYRRTTLAGGSLAIAGVAGVWLAERVFDFKLLPF
ncbi:MAG: HupE/UreJ family protein [Ideonella sp.]|nr:HupE/UreJ family protein [Ideonella sp.]MCC7455453.1 HupE/UreJ family protein [Nitrospira sp.]